MDKTLNNITLYSNKNWKVARRGSGALPLTSSPKVSDWAEVDVSEAADATRFSGSGEQNNEMEDGEYNPGKNTGGFHEWQP